jgi:hypothetical protein
MTRTTGIATVLTVAAALGLAACSSSSSSASGDVDSSFVAKANAICATAVAEHQGGKLPIANFDPLHPQPSQLPAIGQYFAKYGGAIATTTQLDGLAPPGKHAADWTKLRTLLDQVAANSQRQITAAENSDVAAFETTVHTASSLSVQIDKLGPQLGFADSSPCHKVYG